MSAELELAAVLSFSSAKSSSIGFKIFITNLSSKVGNAVLIIKRADSFGKLPFLTSAIKLTRLVICAPFNETSEISSLDCEPSDFTPPHQDLLNRQFCRLVTTDPQPRLDPNPM
jgi:hypothetical protein